MKNPNRLMVAWALCTSLIAACSPAETEPAPTSGPVSLTGDPGDSPEATGVADVDNVPSQPFELLDLAGLTTVTRAVDERIQHCLAEAGFPVASVNVQGGRFDELIYRPETFGPTSAAQAEESGVRETVRAPTETVWSNDPAYDDTRSGCVSRIAEDLPGIDELERSYVDVINQLSSNFRALWVADPRFEAGIGELLDCVESSGYPLADRAAFIESGDFGLFEVDMGTERVTVEGETPPADGVTTVILELEQIDYEPSSAEVDFAREWVRCRGATGFDTTMFDVMTDAQGAALEPVEPTVLELNDRLADALQAVVEDDK